MQLTTLYNSYLCDNPTERKCTRWIFLIKRLRIKRPFMAFVVRDRPREVPHIHWSTDFLPDTPTKKRLLKILKQLDSKKSELWPFILFLALNNPAARFHTQTWLNHRSTP